MGTQNTNEMEVCCPNHISVTSDHRSMMHMKYNGVFVLSISTRSAFPTMYAYETSYNKFIHSLNLLLNTSIPKRLKRLRLH